MTSSTRITATVVAGFVLYATGCNRANEYVAPPPPEVVIAQPVTQQVTDYAEFTGTTRAAEKVDLRARVSGYLQSIEFEDGAYVEKGQLLFVIEPEPFQVTLALEKAKLTKAQASQSLAEAEVKRTTPLVKRGAMSEQELDVKLADRATAIADVAAAKAAVDQAEWNLRYTRITAPISGRIGRHMVDVGNLVLMQTTILTTIESIEPIHVYFHLSENDVRRFMERAASSEPQTGQEAPLYLGFSEAGEFPFEGRLDYTELGVDPDTGTQQRRGVFPNKDHSLLPGMFVRVRLPLGKPQPELLVSERAIGSDQRGTYVLVVNDKNVVERRAVDLGIAQEGKRVVKKGLSAGEWLVVNGLQRARPGATVNPKKVDTIAEKVVPASVIGASIVAEKDSDVSRPTVASRQAGG